jgi:hypothetical protein
MEVSDAIAPQRSSGNNASVCERPPSSSRTSIALRHRRLRGVDLTQIQHRTLHHAATVETLVLDHAPVAVRLAIRLSPGLRQKHDATKLANESDPGEQGRSSLQPFSAASAPYHSAISEIYPEPFGAKSIFWGRIRESGLELLIFFGSNCESWVKEAGARVEPSIPRY